MDKILLNSEVIIYLLSKSLMMLLLFVAFVYSVVILKDWDFNQFTPKQFALENRSYLVSVIIVFALVLKSFLILYFVHTIDALSEFVPGAMCAAGVIKANIYGNYLLMLSLASIFLSFVWMSINAMDIKSLDYPYMRLKTIFFMVLFVLLVVEYGLDWLYFTHIDTQKAVSCCSVIYGKVGGGIPFGLDSVKLLMLFYLLFVLIVLSVWMRYVYISAISALMFLVVGYYSVVYFFGTYIYELPTHKCPFCMLQHYYHYVGYLVWGLLFGGVFLLLDSLIMQIFFKEKSTHLTKVATVMLLLFVALCSGYVMVYYIKNGVFL
jgi:hypothetical protein